ncbi:MAG: helix-turn-helix domain-containing protein, partial [Flavobacteriaceae bacterium]
DCSREWVSEAFNLHPKSLQRMLTKENSNFDAIKDRVRRERVTYYLCNTNASFSRIADLVGYSSQATLSRSCQRWFSKSPREVRGLSKSDRPIYEQNPSHTEIRNLDT